MAIHTSATTLKNSLIYFGWMPNAAEINQKIMDGYLKLDEQDLLKRSHFFGGRHENLYLQRESIPAISKVLEQAECYASNLLNISDHTLRSGFWINDMGPNTVT